MFILKLRKIKSLKNYSKGLNEMNQILYGYIYTKYHVKMDI